MLVLLHHTVLAAPPARCAGTSLTSSGRKPQGGYKLQPPHAARRAGVQTAASHPPPPVNQPNAQLRTPSRRPQVFLRHTASCSTTKKVPACPAAPAPPPPPAQPPRPTPPSNAPPRAAPAAPAARAPLTKILVERGMTEGAISSRFSVAHSSRNSSTGPEAQPTLTYVISARFFTSPHACPSGVSAGGAGCRGAGCEVDGLVGWWSGAWQGTERGGVAH